MSDNLIFIDIETVGNNPLRPLLPVPTAPANYSDAKKIAAYIDKKRQSQIARMPLDVDFAVVRAIGYAQSFDDEPCVLLAANEDEERTALKKFWELVGASPGLRMIGYNLKGFDIPIIMRRSLLLGIKPLVGPLSVPWYSTEQVVDLMQILYNFGHAPGVQARGLKFLAELLGLDVAADGDGSQVANMSDDELRMYCGSDVNLVQQLAARTQGLYW